MTPRELELGCMGRSDLLAEIGRLEKELSQVYTNLTDVQTRCTELLLEVREFRAFGDNVSDV